MTKGSIRQKLITSARHLLNRAGLIKKKVFAIGFNKSGTTSIHALFKTLGLTSYHGVKWRGCDNLKLLRSYDCFSDGIPKDIAKLDNMFPKSKYILQVRELDSWIYSRLAHIKREKEKNTYAGDPILWDNTEQSIKYWIKQRNAHHFNVLSYFADRPSDILVVNFIRDKSAATKICNFLGYKDNYDKPQKNVNPKKHGLKHTEMLNRCIAELGISRSDLRYDILCLSLMNDEMRDRFPFDTSLLDIWQKTPLPNR